MFSLLKWVTLILSALPALLIVRNLRLFAPPPRARLEARPGVSLLVPARNEEATIGPLLDAALSSRGVDLEVIVMDDHSSDRTSEIIREYARRDSRVRLEAAPPLPAGWCGKQHACFSLSQLASHEWLVFCDADVRISADGLARMVAFMQRTHCDLASGVPRQITVGWLEQLLVPLIHLVLLAYLPFDAMRRSSSTAFGAGCGQLFIARRSSYRRVGGHSAIKASTHDGLSLPRAYRAAGYVTDLFDATQVARCRMFTSPDAVWKGVVRNADEGLAAPGVFGPMFTLLLGGQVLPFLVAVLSPSRMSTLSVALSLGARALLAQRFRQSLLGVILHPFAVSILLAAQTLAFSRRRRGHGVTWKGRTAPGRSVVVAH